ncbi:MAG: pyridoxamine 5'-phosphate oxidase family protein [Myxococcota bacterium]
MGDPPELPEILDHIWALIVRGVADRKHPFHQITIATIDPQNGADARTVVLRHCDPDAGTVGFHTDRRAPKLTHLASDPRCAVLLYDHGAKTQIRIHAEASVHSDDAIADEMWEQTRLFSRRCYLAPHAPSTESTRHDPNLPDAFLDTDPDQESSEVGRANFCVVRCRALSIDWLYLCAKGHQRARFDRTGTGWSSTWLRP